MSIPGDANDELHAVRFYRDPESLCGIVAGFLVTGLRAGGDAVVVATAEHWRGIRLALVTSGANVDEHESIGRLRHFDAADLLSQIMNGDMPDAVRFTRLVGPLVAAAPAGSRIPVRIYGEMVDILWKAGQTAAAIRLETLWNGLALRHRYSLLCGYAIGNFYKGAAVDDICGQHSHVLTDAGATTRLA